MMGPRDRGPPKKGLMRTGIRGVAGGVGLASESVKACKEGRTGKMDEQIHATTFRTKSEGEDKSKRDVDAPKDSALYEDTRDDTRHDLEDEWNLDDAQDEIIDDSKTHPVPDISELEDVFLRKHLPPDYVRNALTGKNAASTGPPTT